MPYITFKNENALYHAEKGSTWSNHKYIRIENGRYIYPEDLKTEIKSDNQKKQEELERQKKQQKIAGKINAAVGYQTLNDLDFAFKDSKPHSREKYVNGTATVEKGKKISKLDLAFKHVLTGKYKDVYDKYDIPTMEEHLKKAEDALSRNIRIINTDIRKTADAVKDIDNSLSPVKDAMNDIAKTLVSSLRNSDKSFDAVGAIELFIYYNELASKYNDALTTLNGAVQHNSYFKEAFSNGINSYLYPQFWGNHSYLEDNNGNIRKDLGVKEAKRLIEETFANRI